MPDDQAAATRQAEEIRFGQFRLDLAAQQLWQGRRPVALRRKSWQVLVHLAQRPGALVGVDALLDAVWPGVAVTPNTLTNVIAELRRALGDDARSTRVIETVHRRGYRFIASVGSGSAPTPQQRNNAAAAPPVPQTPFIGRDAELERLQALWHEAQRGRRQVAFVIGEPGIGKTTLVERFARAGAAAPAAWLGRAQCIEQHGTSEAYMPVLEAVEQLAAGRDAARVGGVLRRCAPTWLAQLPALLPSADLDALRAAQLGVRPERMLREGVAMLEALAAERPLLLILEDLHWADPFTPDLIAAVAQRPTAAPLMLLLTYRPVDAVVHHHPVAAMARQLRSRRHATQLPLAPFSSAEVRAYIEQRLVDRDVGARLSGVIERQSSGNPLFVSALLAHMMREPWLQRRDGTWTLTADPERVDLGVPDDLGGVIAAQLSALTTPMRSLLEAGSVEGDELTTRAVAAGAERPLDEVEDLLQEIALRHRLIEPCDVRQWPDGQSSARYRFAHALYRRAVYDAIAPSRRRRLHQRIGECLEDAYGAHAADVATVLARHFTAADDVPRRVRYGELEAVTATARFAHTDAVAHVREALTQLRRQPSTRARWRREAQLELALGNSVSFASGSADPAVAEAFTRAEQLARAAAAPRERFRALLGLGSVHCVAGSVLGFETVVRDQLAMVRRAIPSLAAQAYWRAGQMSLAKGALQAARRYLADARRAKGESGIPVVVDFRSLAELELAVVLTLLGKLDAAQRTRAAGLRRSESSGLLFSHCQALWLAVVAAAVQRDDAAVVEFSAQCTALADRCGFVSFRGIRPLATAARAGTSGAIRARRQSMADNRPVSGRWYETLSAVRIALACVEAGDRDGALASVASGLQDVEQLGQRWLEAELWRLKGEALALPGRRRRATPGIGGDAETCLRRAVAVARAQHAALLELRAATSLARLLQQRGDTRAARAVLAPRWASFKAGGDCADLRDARELLAGLDAD